MIVVNCETFEDRWFVKVERVTGLKRECLYQQMVAHHHLAEDTIEAMMLTLSNLRAQMKLLDKPEEP